LLFLFFVNDLPDVLVDVFIRLFADDSKLFRELSDPQSSITLQCNLDIFSTWCLDWQISINAEKCSVLHIGKDNPMSMYYVNDVAITSKSVERDLGYMLSVDLKPSAHIQSIVGKSLLKANLIFKVFHCKDVEFLVKMYIIYIRPILEYASPVWSPYLLQDIDHLESVQRSFTRRIPGFSSLNYVERLIACNLEPLEIRRIRIDLIMLYKILHCLVVCPFFDFFSLSQGITRGHRYKLQKNFSKSTVRQHFFCNRVIDVWNDLPEIVVNSPTLSSFKFELLKVNLVKFSHGRTIHDLH
jgi:ribonucleases P/MRP protein subunit RPP40